MNDHTTISKRTLQECYTVFTWQQVALEVIGTLKGVGSQITENVNFLTKEKGGLIM